MGTISERMRAVETARTENFLELVKIAELNPAKSFRYGNLKHVDFTGCDLSGFDFTGANLEGANFDGTDISGATFDCHQLTRPELRSASDYEDFFRKSEIRLPGVAENRTRESLIKNMMDTIRAISPENSVLPVLPEQPSGKTILISVGYSASTMAKAVEDNWTGPIDGIVLTRYGMGGPSTKFEKIEAAHPVPDRNTVKGANRILDLVGNMTEEDLLLVMLSSGASSLLSAPLGGISLDDLSGINRRLLMSGAALDEINLVRNHLTVFGNRGLAKAAYPAKVVTLVLSDGSDEYVRKFGGSPTISDGSTGRDALDILRKYDIDTPQAVEGLLTETPETNDEQPSTSDLRIAASGESMLRKLYDSIGSENLDVINLGVLEGDAGVVAHGLAEKCRTYAGEKRDERLLLISSGELSVAVTGHGESGPSLEFLLSLAVSLDGLAGVSAISINTSGADGGTNAAGAFISPTTLVRAAASNIDPQAYLQNNDAYNFFRQLDDLVVTGPTGLDMGDLRAILIEPSA